MVHSVEPILPFDLAQATFLVPDLTKPLSTGDLLAVHAHQLQKRSANLAAIHNCVLASCYTSIRQFEKHYANTICDFNFAPGSLILMRNTNLGMDKMKPRYLGPMIVLRRSCNSAYRLGKLDGAISSLCYAAFRLIPYYACSQSFIPVTQVVDSDHIASMEYNDTSVQGAGSRSDESTQEG